MEVMDAPYRAGDLRHGYQAVAVNLSNRPLIRKKETKKIFFKNFMDARVRYVILPLAQKLMQPASGCQGQRRGGYFLCARCLHEISMAGPRLFPPEGKQMTLARLSALHTRPGGSRKPTCFGMFGLKWPEDHGCDAKGRWGVLRSYVAGIFARSDSRHRRRRPAE